MEQQSPLSRRRILVGTAWAAPAVLVATSLPAAAGSLRETLTMTAVGAVALTDTAVTTNAVLATNGDDDLTVRVRAVYPPAATDAEPPPTPAGWVPSTSDQGVRYWEFVTTIPAGGSVTLPMTKTSGGNRTAFSVRYSIQEVTGYTQDPSEFSTPGDLLFGVMDLVTADVLVFNNVTYADLNGRVDMNFGYQLRWTAGYPEGTVATSHWSVHIVGNGVDLFQSGTAPINNAGSVKPPDRIFTDVAPGVYTSTITVWAEATAHNTYYFAKRLVDSRSVTVT